MNILWIVEGIHTNPNFKISVKIASRLSQDHKIHIALYGGEKASACEELKGIFSDVIPLEREVFSTQRNSNVRKLGKVSRFHIVQQAKSLCNKLMRIKWFCTNRLEKICCDNEIDVIIGTVFPFKIAKIVSEADVKAKKIVVQLDPYSGNMTLPKDKSASRLREELCVVDSINALFTTVFIKKDILSGAESQNSLRDNKIRVIEFPEISKDLHDFIDKKTSLSKLTRNDQEVIISYTGTFYDDIRNPKYLVNLLRALPSNYKLVIAGVNTYLMQKDEDTKNRIIDMGLLEQDEATKLREKSDILVCFNNLASNQVPSKLFECIETGKPFINLCQLENCPTLPYVDGYENALTVFVNDINPEAIVKFVETHKGTIISREVILKRYYKHTYEYVANQIEEEIKTYVSI